MAAADPPEHPSSVGDRRRPPRWWMPVVIALVGATIGWGLRRRIGAVDEQDGNIAAVLTWFLSAFLVLALIIRAARARGRTGLALGGISVGIVALIVLFRFDGFSGELWPQLKWRFANSAPPRQTFQPQSVSRPDVATPKQTEVASDGEAIDQNVPPSPPGAEDWPQFLGPARNGILNDRLFEVPQSSEDVESLWDIGVGSGWASFAVAEDFAVTLEQRGDDECVTAYGLLDAEPRWIVRHPRRHDQAVGGEGPRSTPTIDRGQVFTQGAQGTVHCIDLASGEVRWKVELIEDRSDWSIEASELRITWGRAASPLVIDDLVVLPLGGSDAATDRSLIALDRSSGETVWKSGADNISFASPVMMTLDDVRQIVSVNENSVTGHRIDDGETLWDFPWPGSSNAGPTCASAVAVDDNQFLIGKGYGGGSSLVRVTRGESQSWQAEEVWHSNTLLKTKFNHAVIQNPPKRPNTETDSGASESPIAYAISNGALEAVELLPRPKRLWRQSRSTRLGQGHVVLAGEWLVGQSEFGPIEFIEATAEEYRPQFTLQALEPIVWNVPTLAGRYLIVRNSERARCFRLPAR